MAGNFSKKEKKVEKILNPLYFEINPTQLPIVYCDKYNITFLGLQKIHPFDGEKWGKVFEYLCDSKIIDTHTIVQPNKIQDDDLLKVHTEDYLKSLKVNLIISFHF